VTDLEKGTKLNTEDTHNYACPGCGSNMVFDPETQTLKCLYCESSQEIQPQHCDIKEYNFETAEDSASTNWGNETKVLQCKNCGSQVVLYAVDTASSCSFCGSSYIIKNKESAGIAPESLIPFRISQKKAMDMFSKWIKKRFFAPKALKTNHKSERINGVYVPCWTYDANTHSHYTAEVGTYYYVTETYTENGQSKTRQVRKTRWSFTSGNYSKFYDDVLVNASKQTEGGLMTALEPFYLKELTGYDPKFLSGFAAERYSVGLKEGFESAKRTIDGYIHSSVRGQIYGDEVRNLQIGTSYFNMKFKHILLPVWISAYTYKNKVYRYLVNGQTGEVQGHAPVSPLKIALLISSILAVCFLGYYFFTSSS
jgi:DNA-directed RNA polymerase subunit RPC12/RpoP